MPEQEVKKPQKRKGPGYQQDGSKSPGVSFDPGKVFGNLGGDYGGKMGELDVMEKDLRRDEEGGMYKAHKGQGGDRSRYYV